MFTAALLTIAKIGSNLSVHQQMNEERCGMYTHTHIYIHTYIHTYILEYYSATKKNKILPLGGYYAK